MMRQRFPTFTREQSRSIRAIACSFLVVGLAHAQPVTSGKSSGGFKYPAFDDNNRLETLLTGESFELISANQLLVHQLRLESYKENGDVDFIVTAPECLFDRVSKQAWSTNQLHVKATDEQFSIQGTGFLWDMDHSLLHISNSVHTVLRNIGGLVEGPQNSSAANNANYNNENPSAPREVYSDRFRFNADSGEAVYQGHVTALDPGRLQLQCEWLGADLPVKQGRLQQIEAKTNVVIQLLDPNRKGRISSDNALYRISSHPSEPDTVLLTGHPQWQTAPYQGRADSIRFLLREDHMEMHAQGNGWVQLPRPAQPSKHTDESNENAAKTVNQENPIFVEIRSGRYSLVENEVTFHDEVHVEDPEWDLQCGNLVAYLRGENGHRDLSELIAEDHVVWNYQGDEAGPNGRQQTHAEGRRMVYSAESGVITLSGNPSFSTPEYLGRGDVIRLDRVEQTFSAQGNASLTILGKTVRQMGDLLQNQAPGNEVTKRQPQTAADSKPVEGAAVVIHSSEYSYRSRQLVFSGGVVVQHPSWTITCHRLALQVNEKQVVETITASDDVVVSNNTVAAVEGATPKKPWRIRCREVVVQVVPGGRAIQTVTATGNVHFEQGENKARGQKAVFEPETHLVILTGQPELETDRLHLTNASRLLWNRLSGKVAATGFYQIVERTSDMEGNPDPERRDGLPLIE